jgi:predicted short-subunit dehydrogenase-like oxidoreductase (DUF2520 family)
MKISIVGRGNVAYHLYHAAKNQNVEIEALITRDEKPISWATNDQITSKNLQNLDSELIFLAISDDAIEEVFLTYKFPSETTIVHCSGTLSLEAISNLHSNTGVIYPFQTFSFDKTIDLKTVQTFTEYSNPKAKTTIDRFCSLIFPKNRFLDSVHRLKLHLAAVFANNFTNHMLTIAENILEESNLPANVIYDLVDETIAKYKTNGAAKSQTGPASRGDQKTINAHLEKLKTEELREIYKSISSHIKNHQ